MNAYCVVAGWVGFETSPSLPYLVFAPTRDRARALLMKAQGGGPKWLVIKRVRLVARNVDRPEGFADIGEDELWDVAWDVLHGKDEEIEDAG